MDIEKNIIAAEEEMKKYKNQSFIIKHGKGKVMFSAPHFVEQIRNGKIKFSEPQTGLLAEMLHNEFGCPVIIKTLNCGDDANYDAVSDYREALIHYVKENGIELLIDLHQLAPSRKVMINIGTGKGKNIKDAELIDSIISVFEKNNCAPVIEDKPFSASYRHTVSSSVHRECKINCVQIEINSSLLCGKDGEFIPEPVYKALSEIYLLYSRR